MISYEMFYEEYFPFWEKLSKNDKEYLCQNSSIVHFEKEQVLHSGNE